MMFAEGIFSDNPFELTLQANREYRLYAKSSIDPIREVLEAER